MHDPRVPETLEGWSVLHQMFRIRWPEWRVRPEDLRQRLAARGGGGARRHAPGRGGHDGAGHAARPQGRPHAHPPAPLASRSSRRRSWRSPGSASRPSSSRRRSFVSIVELGMYEMTAQIHRRLGERGLKTGSDGVRARLRRRDGGAEKARLGPPLDGGARAPARLLLPDEQAARRAARTGTRRPVEERARMMLEHGKIGRHYAGAVTQIISGRHRLRRLGVGRRPLRRRPRRLQEADLRDALRRGLGLVRGVRAVLRRPAVLARPSCRSTSRARSRRSGPS